MTRLLHPELIDRIPLAGHQIKQELIFRVAEVTNAAFSQPDPNVSIVIRSRNNADQLEMLFDDIDKQDFSGEREVIVVDTESTDGTPALARSLGATLLSISQSDFNYPRSLNLGFDAASHPWVFSFVDHSLFTNTHTLQTATRWNQQSDVAGAYGSVLPNRNATPNELVWSGLLQAKYFRQSAAPATPKMGFMQTNAGLFRREAWQEAGKFDEAYAAGGEDGAIGRKFIEAGMTVISEPALTVFHSHGLHLLQTIKQFKYWSSLDSPQAFSQGRLARYRRGA